MYTSTCTYAFGIAYACMDACLVLSQPGALLIAYLHERPVSEKCQLGRMRSADKE